METHANDPINSFIDQNDDGQWHGLTKREYFAAMALQGLCANQIIKEVINKAKSQKDFDSYLTNTAVSIADSLIDSLNK
jgi:hypothetical protein